MFVCFESEKYYFIVTVYGCSFLVHVFSEDGICPANSKMNLALSYTGTFWLYACLAFGGAILLALILPETKGRTLEEVEGLFARCVQLLNY